ncbi:MAG: 30S ribosomal protein S6 [Eubacteriales bacterium]
MEKKLCSYEVLYAVNATLPEESIRALVEKFNTLIAENATDVTVDEWGKRRLAYPIQDVNDGYLLNVSFKSETSFPRELERQMRIADGILRVMITRKTATAKAEEVPAAMPAEAEAEETTAQ